MTDASNQTPVQVPLLGMAVTVGTICSAAYFGMVYVVTIFSYRLNVIFGLFCSMLFALPGLLGIWANYQLARETSAGSDDHVKPLLVPFLNAVARAGKTDPKPDPGITREAIRRTEITFFVPVFTLFVASWTSLAYGLAKLNPAAYAHPERLSFGLVLQHYLWHIVDMAPLVDAWKNLHIDDPLPETQLWPGILVVIFRLIVLYLVLAAATKLLGLDKHKKSGE